MAKPGFGGQKQHVGPFEIAVCLVLGANHPFPFPPLSGRSGALGVGTWHLAGNTDAMVSYLFNLTVPCAADRAGGTMLQASP